MQAAQNLYHPTSILSTLLATDIEQYRREGYTIARQVLTSDELEVLRTACNDLCAYASNLSADHFDGITFYNMHRNANPFASDIQETAVVIGQLRRVTYPYAVSQVFNEFRAHPQLLANVAALLGDDLVQIVNQVNFNPPNIGTGWGWHQDYRFRKPGITSPVHDFVQTILAIDLCNTYTGGLRLIPRSHELGELTLDTNNEQAEQYFDAHTAITPEMQPGDVIFFNPLIIHGSGANRSPNLRRVYINGYGRASACSTGMPVLIRGQASSKIVGTMEYEGDRKTLPLASKY